MPDLRSNHGRFATRYARRLARRRCGAFDFPPAARLARRPSAVSLPLALVTAICMITLHSTVRPVPAAETAGDPRAVAAAAPPPQGSLVIIGGGARHDNEAIWRRIVELARRPKPKVAVFPCASIYPLKNGRKAVDHFNRLGADAFLVPVAPTGLPDVDYRTAVRDPALVESVRSADVVFFIGGSQGKIRDALVDDQGRHTPLLDAVWDVYRRGGVVAGTSAGAAVMSRLMFRDAGNILATLAHGVSMGKELDHGLGFLDADWFVDQHCLVRGRFARSLVAMQTAQVPYGIGIDEDTAIVVERGVEAQVIGVRGAVLIDLSEAASAVAPANQAAAATGAENGEENKPQHGGEAFRIAKAKISYLNHGDRFHLKTLAISPSQEKLRDRKIDPAAPDFQPGGSKPLFYNDILGNTTLLDVLVRVIDHRDGRATGLAFDGAAAQKGPTTGFEFQFYRGPHSVGWQTEVRGATDSTIQNIYLDVRPVDIHGPIYSVRP